MSTLSTCDGVEKRNRCRNNLINVDDIFEKFKGSMSIVIKIVLVFGKYICQRKLFVSYHIDATIFLTDCLIVSANFILP